MLAKPHTRRILRPLERLPLHIIIRIPLRRKPMRHAREILIIKLHPKRRQHLQAMFLQLGRKRKVILRGQNLYRHSHVVIFFFGGQRRMSDRDAVDEGLPLCAELEAGPAAVAVADGADFLVLGLEFFCGGSHFGEASFFAWGGTKLACGGE